MIVTYIQFGKCCSSIRNSSGHRGRRVIRCTTKTNQNEAYLGGGYLAHAHFVCACADSRWLWSQSWTGLDVEQVQVWRITVVLVRKYVRHL